jgi:uncharacterized damage-inducible protein DinB
MTLGILLSNWDRARSKLIETIDCFEEQDLAFRPFVDSWTVRELMIHIAHEEMGEVGYGIIQELPEWPEDYNPSDYETLESIKALLADVRLRTMEYLEKQTDTDLERVVEAPWGMSYRLGELIGHVVEHEIHHRGELALILGLLGRQAPDI